MRSCQIKQKKRRFLEALKILAPDSRPEIGAGF